MLAASSTSRSTSRTRMRVTGLGPVSMEFLPEAIFSFTVCPMDTDGSVPVIERRIGPMDVLPSRMKRWTRYGTLFRMKRQLRYDLNMPGRKARALLLYFFAAVDLIPKILNCPLLATKTSPLVTSGTRLALPPMFLHAPARIFASVFIVCFVTFSGSKA